MKKNSTRKSAIYSNVKYVELSILTRKVTTLMKGEQLVSKDPDSEKKNMNAFQNGFYLVSKACVKMLNINKVKVKC